VKLFHFSRRESPNLVDRTLTLNEIPFTRGDKARGSPKCAEELALRIKKQEVRE